MQLAILLVVVCAVAGTGSPAAMPLGGAAQAVLEMLSCLAVAPLATAALHAALAHRQQAGTLDARYWSRYLERWQSLAVWIWVAGCLGALHLANWPQVVRSVAFTLVWPLLDDVVILMPLIVSLVLVWIAMYHIERTLYPAADRPADEPNISLSRYLALRVRHHLGLTLLPALAILGIQETAVQFGLVGGADDRRAWWLWGALLAAAVIALPLALKCLWQAERVADSPLKRRLFASCRRVGCPVRDIVVWRTGGTLANAAVAGLLPGLRTIFLSDGLIARLSDEEIDVVVRHEAAHLARRHLWQRLILLGLPALAYFALQARQPELAAQIPSLLTSAGIAPVWQTTLLIPLAAVAYALLAVGWLARQHEHDADLAACCAVAPTGPAQASSTTVDSQAVGILHSALAKLVGSSDEYHRSRWLHPSVVERVQFLERVQHHPPLAPRFRGRLLWLSCFLLVACAAALAAGLWPV